MNIVMVTSDLPPDPGGIATHVVGLAAAMVRAGHRVAVVHNQKDPRLSERYRRCVSEFGGYYFPAYGDFVSASGLRRFTRLLRRNWSVLRIIRLALKRLRDAGNDFEVIHFHDIMNTTAVSAFFRKPTVWTNHSSQFYELEGGRLMAARLVTQVEQIITPSSELATLTNDKLRRSAVFIPNGIDPRKFSERGQDRVQNAEFNVFIPRRMVFKNGIDVAIEALHLLPRPSRSSRYRVLIPTSGAAVDYERELRERLVDLPQWVKVDLLGSLNPEEMGAFYAQSDMALIPSRVEAVSISALEALAWGVPLACSSVGGLKDAFSGVEHVRLLDPESPPAVAEAIEEMEKMSFVDRRELGAAGSVWVKNEFSWDSVAEKVLDVYAGSGVRGNVKLRV